MLDMAPIAFAVASRESKLPAPNFQDRYEIEYQTGTATNAYKQNSISKDPRALTINILTPLRALKSIIDTVAPLAASRTLRKACASRVRIISIDI
jgi:hypothetical protein